MEENGPEWEDRIRALSQKAGSRNRIGRAGGGAGAGGMGQVFVWDVVGSVRILMARWESAGWWHAQQQRKD